MRYSSVLFYFYLAICSVGVCISHCSTVFVSISAPNVPLLCEYQCSDGACVCQCYIVSFSVMLVLLSVSVLLVFLSVNVPLVVVCSVGVFVC